MAVSITTGRAAYFNQASTKRHRLMLRKLADYSKDNDGCLGDVYQEMVLLSNNLHLARIEIAKLEHQLAIVTASELS